MANSEPRIAEQKTADQSLAGVILFDGLSAPDRDTLAKRCRWRRYACGQHMISHHDASIDVYFVASGAMRATFFTKAGKQVTFRDVTPGGFFGELAAVVATADSLIASMRSDAFRKVVQQYVPVAVAMRERMQELATQWRRSGFDEGFSIGHRQGVCHPLPYRV